MAIFKLPKRIDEIQEQELLPSGWYKMRLMDEPAQEENKALREGGEGAEGAGHNIVMKLTTMSDNPVYNGRNFYLYLALPREGDSEKFFNGQSQEDSKLETIAQIAAAFNGEEASGDEVDLSSGQEAMFYVTIKPSYRDESVMVNEIDRRETPRSVE